jgi:CHAD domain
VSKGKRSSGKSKRRKDGAAPDSGGSRPEQAPKPDRMAAAEPSSRRPPGQRLWDMPYSAQAPRMINPAIGLHNLVARAGHNAGYDIDLTLLDAPDHRMIRSGILLAHRVLDGRGEWYLGAPDWVPLLPKERIDPLGHGDLPQELADLIRPFRRRATLGPVAALRCERREFALRNEHGVTVALLRDDRVTVRRGGLTTARYREVMMTPIGPGLTEDQDFWLSQVLGMSGATRVEKFPRLVARLGAPANGLTDFPSPPQTDGTTPFGVFVTSLMGRRLHQLLEADLSLQAGRPMAADELCQVASRLQREIRTVVSALDVDWISDLDEELGWLADQARLYEPSALTARLRSERYLTLLERLVTASRTGRSGDARARPTSVVLESMLDRSWRRLGKSADRLRADPSPEAWEAARSALADVLGVCDLIEELEPGRFDALRRRLTKTADQLTEAGRRAAVVQLTRDRAAQATPLEAFELGRRYEHELTEARASREAFASAWAKAAKKHGPPARPAQPEPSSDAS